MDCLVEHPILILIPSKIRTSGSLSGLFLKSALSLILLSRLQIAMLHIGSRLNILLGIVLLNIQFWFPLKFVLLVV